MSSICGDDYTFHGCSILESSYDVQEKLGEGTFGEVHKALHKSSKKLVALKKIFLHNEKEGFPITALREIRILKDLDHLNIIDLMDISIQKGDRSQRKRNTIYMVTPYMEHDLAGLLDNPNVKFSLAQIKTYMEQLLQGINYMHQKSYLHRDIKAANLLIDNRGNLKIADFGLARRYLGAPPTIDGAGPGLHSYTGLVVTRWYRPPELILGNPKYTTAIDMWGIGCVFGEMFRKRPILQGNSDLDQGCKIFELLGSPNEENMPGYQELIKQKNFTFGSYPRKLETVFQDLPPSALSLLSGLLALDPIKRLSALGALNHDFFNSDPPPLPKHKLPTYSDSHELNAKKNCHPHPPNESHANNTLPEQYVNETYWNDQHQYQQGYRQKRHRNNRYEYQDHHSRGRGGGRRNYRNDHHIPPYRQNGNYANQTNSHRFPNHLSSNGSGSQANHPQQQQPSLPPYRKKQHYHNNDGNNNHNHNHDNNNNNNNPNNNRQRLQPPYRTGTLDY